MQLNVSPDIAAVLEKAVGFSVRRGQFFVGIEHLFAALLDEVEPLPQRVRDEYLTRLFAVMRELDRTAWKGGIRSESGDVFHTPRAIAVTNQASKLAERYGGGPAAAGHLLLAILNDPRSAPSRVMDDLALGREECVSMLRTALSGTTVPSSVPAAASTAPTPLDAFQPATAHPKEPEAPRAALAPAPLTRDLSEAARQGKLQPAVGRNQELFEILQILTRRAKNNVMLVGEAGVGKTQVVEGLARKLAKRQDDPRVPRLRILELNIAAMMTGTQYRGAFEEKVLGLLEQLQQSKDTVLFIDEAHLIMGAGATEGDAMDLANLLKPALGRGEIRCIGATTLQEYRKFVEKDPAIERRFQMVRIEELSPAASLEVLRRLRPSLESHHGVKIASRALHTAIELTQRYMPNLNLPDKAIDVLDQACARHRLTAVAMKSDPGILKLSPAPGTENRVTPHGIRKVVSQVTAIPLEEMTAEERRHLGALEHRIKRQLIGQDEAVAAAVAAVKKSRAGLADPKRPDAVFLFLGPSGVGKTQLAKLLAEHLFGSRDHLIAFDMSEYIEEHSVARLLGAPPGYVGHEEEGRLTGAVRNTPFAILLFDEIEKAHPRIFDLFLPIFDEGRLKDGRGRDVSFRNCIIVLTSNIGAKLLYRTETGEQRRALMEELRRYFRPEFINRIDEIVPFYPLLLEDVRSILHIEIAAVRKRLQSKHLGLRVYQRAYEFLAQQGYSAEYGAREIRRTVDQYITTPLSNLLIKGEFQPGDMIDALMEGRQLIFRKGTPHHSTKQVAP